MKLWRQYGVMSLYVWMSIAMFYWVIYIYLHNLLIVCGFIAKIDNKFIIILVGKEFVKISLLAISFLFDACL